VDLFDLIGGSWPPAPREPEHPDYGSVPARSTMQRSSQHERALYGAQWGRPVGADVVPQKMSYPYLQELSDDEIPLCVLAYDQNVCGDGPEELYDSPALGSPRAAPAQSASPLHLQEDIGVGSLVEVATDVDQQYYGVSVCGLGDGARGGARLFSCAAGRALFVPLPLCRRDARFRDTPPPDPAHPGADPHLDQPECPLVAGVVPPLSALGELAGKNRGIQGHHNSCYLDATLFAMFTFTSVFDALLYRPPEPEDSPAYLEVQRVLREEVVNPLRRRGYVRADRVMRLRTLLERLSDDPEEFLNGLVAQLLRAEPFLKLSSGQEAFCYQLFVEKDEHCRGSAQYAAGWRVGSAARARAARRWRPAPSATPATPLSVPEEFAPALEAAAPRVYMELFAVLCIEPSHYVAFVKAGAQHDAPCIPELGAWLSEDGGRALHAAAPLDRQLPAPAKRLLADAYMCFYRSPDVAIPQLGAWLSEEGGRALHAAAPLDRQLPAPAKRLLADAYMCFYRSPDVAIPQLGAWLSEEGGRALHAAAPLDRQLPAPAKRLLADAYMCFYRSPDVAMYR
ncbi:hypothetical protein MSG28_002366, partial [Choristoneura fumiferana]